MTTRASISALVAGSILAFTALAATVPQDTSDKYYFSRPNLPSNIVGRILGIPAEYNVMRSEDIAWLYEAYMERAALLVGWTGLEQEVELIPEFGTWPMSETNRFARWCASSVTTNGITTTNIVVGYNYVTNYGSGVDHSEIAAFQMFTGDVISNPACDENGYLSTNDDLLVSAPAVAQYEGLVTNVWTETVVTNMDRRAESVIEMTMTNGTTSAYTNIWNFSVTGLPYRVVHTNVRAVTAIDSIFKSGAAVGYSARISYDDTYFWGPFRTASATNAYAWLDGARRLARYVSYTNLLQTWEYSWGKYRDPEDQIDTHPSGRLFQFSRWTNASKMKGADGQVVSADDWGGSDEYPKPSSGGFVFVGDVRTNAVMAGGVNRLSRARIWAVVGVSFSIYADGNTSSGESMTYSTNRVMRVVVPLGDMTQLPSTQGIYGDRIHLLYNVDLRNIYETALSTAGFAVPVRGTHPALHFDLAEPTTEISTYSSVTERTSASMDFVVVLDFSPWTQIPGGTP